MCDLSHKTFLYSEEKKENFIKNNLVQKSLRQKVQDLYETIEEQE
jgi:hypothetical protein